MLGGGVDESGAPVRPDQREGAGPPHAAGRRSAARPLSRREAGRREAGSVLPPRRCGQGEGAARRSRDDDAASRRACRRTSSTSARTASSSVGDAGRRVRGLSRPRLSPSASFRQIPLAAVRHDRRRPGRWSIRSTVISRATTMAYFFARAPETPAKIPSSRARRRTIAHACFGVHGGVLVGQRRVVDARDDRGGHVFQPLEAVERGRAPPRSPGCRLRLVSRRPVPMRCRWCRCRRRSE